MADCGDACDAHAVSSSSAFFAEHERTGRIKHHLKHRKRKCKFLAVILPHQQVGCRLWFGVFMLLHS